MYDMVSPVPNSQVTFLSPASRFQAGENVTSGGIIVPTDFSEPELGAADAHQRAEFQVKTTDPEVEVRETAVDTDASDSSSTGTSEKPIDNLLTDTLVSIFNLEDEIRDSFLIKFHDVKDETSRANEASLREFLEEVNQTIQDEGDLKAVFDKASPDVIAAISDRAQGSFQSLLKPILEHGSLAVAAAKISNGRLGETLKVLGSMYEPAKERSELMKEGTREKYASDLRDFKDELATIIEKDANTAVHNDPRIARTMQTTKDAKFQTALGALVSKYSGKVAKEGLRDVAELLKEGQNLSKSDPTRAEQMGKLKDVLFNKEALMIGAMLLPFLGAVLSGTLGKVGFFKPLVKPIAQLLNSGQSIMNQIISIGYMISNKHTTDTLAATVKPQAASQQAQARDPQPFGALAS